MTLSEEAMSFLEEHTYWAALASGSSVLVSENGDLVEVFPDGTHKFIKRLPPAIPVIRGQKLEKHE